MILTGPKIEAEVKRGNIIIEPYESSQINPNSYDFRIGDKLLIYSDKILDTKKQNPTRIINIPKSGYVLRSNKIYLGHTIEKIGSNYYVPVVRGKSSTGRVGLFVHITADLIDIGYIGQFTLMLHAVQPVRIYPNMRIGQVTFWKVMGKIILYNGKYQGGIGPQASAIYKDFITAFKKTPDFQSGDELNADMSSSFGRGNRGIKSAEDVIKKQ